MRAKNLQLLRFFNFPYKIRKINVLAKKERQSANFMKLYLKTKSIINPGNSQSSSPQKGY
jgi:hypothetical protein